MSPKVLGRGPLDARIMIVGEAPGAQEEREGRPFVGAAGQLLEEMLLKSGIDPSHVRFTNLCGIRPPGNEIRAFHDSKGVPNATLLEGLMDLKDEIAAVSPTIIIPVGNYPLRYITGKGHWTKEGWTGISDWRGSVVTGTELAGTHRKCLATFHPANVLRQYSNNAIVRMDLGKALAESAFPEIRRLPHTLVLDPRGEERRYWQDRVLASDGKLISADIEYVGGHLICCGFTTSPDEAFVVHNREPADLRFIRDLLCSGKGLCFQNGMFDCSILEWHFDIPCVQYLRYDTMVAAHACYPEFPKDLGFLASVWTDQPNWKGMINWKAVSAGTQPFSDVLAYNAIDTWVTADIMEKQIAEDLVDPAYRWILEHEMSLIQPLWEISKRGVPIDVSRLNTLKTTLETEADTLGAGLTMLNGGFALNPNSGPQLAKFLQAQGFKLTAKTPAGAWKTDDNVLAGLALKAAPGRAANTIKAIRSYKERRSLVSKFCDIELDTDGRMRCHYDPAKTTTGRLSSRKFYPTGRGSNLQNIPRDGRVRSVFIPDHNKLFGYADLKQAESYVVAHITRDPEMLRLHQDSTLDGHKVVAAYLFDKPIASITKDERFIGKKTRHACNYTLGPNKLQTYINAEAQETGVSITLAEAKVIVAKYRQLHYMLPRWWRNVEVELLSTRTLTTLLGRKRVFYGRISENLPEAVAFGPQGTVADTLNIGLIRAHRSEELRDLGFEMLLQVHDAIGFQYPESNAERVFTLLRECMSVELMAHDTPFTIGVDIQYGANWGEKSDVNPNGLVVWNG